MTVRKQDAITLLGVSEKVFQRLIDEKVIRRTSLRNGRYSYNEDDVRKYINLIVKQTTETIKVDNLSDEVVELINEKLSKTDKLVIKTNNEAIIKFFSLVTIRDITVIN